MFSHIMLGTNDIEKSKAFYDAVLGALGYQPGVVDPKGRCFWITPKGVFCVSVPIDGQAACHGNGSTIGFQADNPAAVESSHEAGLASGGTSCENPPGERQGTSGKLYLAYLRDPDNNKICIAHRM